jgi:hypothetical protein
VAHLLLLNTLWSLVGVERLVHLVLRILVLVLVAYFKRLAMR